MRTTLALVALVGIAVSGGALYVKFFAGGPAAAFRTAKVTRGDISAVIAASGTVEPEQLVDVGAQVAGRIERLGPDPRGKTDPRFQGKTVDYSTPVNEGDTLAWIDPALYEADVNRDQANLDRAIADLGQMKAKADQAEREWKRAERLRPLRAVADSDYDLAVANYKMAEANVKVGEAVIEQARAALKRSKRNLDYTVIRSPVDGIIIDRRVNVGQTVVASLNAPSLFLIAKDLKRVEVWASVNEADIGRIRSRPQMPVRFTVDAYPKDVFRGQVAQIRLNARTNQQVVVYTVVVVTDNSDLKLPPYLTANMQFEADHCHDVLRVPNGALRWKPRPQQVHPDVREAVAPTLSGKQGGRADRGGEKSPGEASTSRGGKDRGERGRLWVADGQFVRPVDVEVGLTDGTLTEVSGGDLREDMDVVLGAARNDQVEDAVNPFAPPRLRGRPKS